MPQSVFGTFSLELTPDFISSITGFPLGLLWSKEEKALGQVAKKTFFQPGEDPVEDKNGVRGQAYLLHGMKLATK